MPYTPPATTEEKIADALRAAPPHIAATATVVDHDLTTVLREGSSEWTCMPTPPDKPQPAPMCGDQATIQWFREWFAGKTPTIDRIGISYMLMGEAGADFDHPEVTAPPDEQDWYHVGPHLMMVFPAAAGDIIKGIGRDTASGIPYARPFRGAQPLLVMPIALPGQRVTWLADAPGSKQARYAGDRYECLQCGTTLIYETTCPCNEACKHSEICCNTTMVRTAPRSAS